MIHPSSIVDDSAKIDNSVEIGPFCLIGPEVEIDAGTKIESHVILKGPAKIGKGNHIFQFSTLGDGSPDKKYKNEPTTLVIGDDNIIREGVTIHTEAPFKIGVKLLSAIGILSWPILI